ncbi:MAG: DUF1972 domain-containing protein [Bacteroidota bacterium]
MRKLKKIALIGVVGVPARYGGLETLAHHLVLQWRGKYELTVFNSAKHYTAEERKPAWEGAAIKYLPLKANGAQSILYDMWSMLKAIRSHDALLILGVSGCLLLPILKFFFPRKAMLVNIDGLEWRRPKWGKLAKGYLKLAEKIAVKFADRIIADNKAIQDYVADVYGRESDMIAYGGDHAQTAEILPEDRETYSFLSGPYAVKACRIEPENNIEMILEAFSRFDDISLVIMGNWVDSAFGRDMRARYAHHKHLFLLDFIRDQRVLNMLRANASVYLHGHSAGGTNPSLVEAMNLALPIVAYGVVFNRESTEHKAVFFESADELLGQLRELTAERRESLGQTMKEVAQRRYTWPVIAGEYARSVEKAMAGEKAVFFDLGTPALSNQK